MDKSLKKYGLTISKNNEIKELLEEQTKKDEWLKYYEEVKTFYETHGHIFIPLKYKVNNIKIGKWLEEQKRLYKSQNLESFFIKKLESLEIIWDARTKEGRIKKQEILTKKEIESIKLIDEEVITTFSNGTIVTTEKDENKEKNLKQQENITEHQEENETSKKVETQVEKEEISEISEDLIEEITDKVTKVEQRNQRKKELIETAETLINMLREVRAEEARLDKKINEIIIQMQKELGDNSAQR